MGWWGERERGVPGLSFKNITYSGTVF